MIFTINFLISVNNIRSYLEIESEIHAQDTATSLGLSLSPYLANADDPMIQTMMNVIFDRGYYKEIKLTDREGKELIKLTNEKVFEEIPQWFIDALPMKTATGTTEISSGWTIGGSLDVVVNPGYGYLKLYEQAKSAFQYSLIAFLLSLLLLTMILRLTLLPLKRIDRLARSIAGGEFETITKLPWTTEIRNVALSMNHMSGKIEGVIRNLHAKLEKINRRLKSDDLTGLDIKSTFETDMKQLFMSKQEAFVFIVKADCLGGYAKDRGNEAADAFLKDFAHTLNAAVKEADKENDKVYRFYGGEFAVIARAANRIKAAELAELLGSRFSGLAQQYGLSDIAHIGVAPFDPIGTTATILSAAAEAYEQAKLIGANGYFIREAEKQAKNPAEWKALLERVIDGGEFKVSYVGQVYALAQERPAVLLMEEAFTRAFDEEGEPIAIGAFVSIAEKHGRIADLDKGVIMRTIQHILRRGVSHDIAVNLSMESIRNTDFRYWLTDILTKYRTSAKQMVFSMTAYAVIRDVEAFKRFADLVHENGARVILKRFETQFVALEEVKHFKLDFIRLAREYTLGIATDPGKKTFVEAMKELGGLLDIRIIAEEVKSEQDFEVVKSIGIYGASR